MPLPEGRFRVRPMSRDELPLALRWAAEEGWNPGLHDAEPFWAADPHGFFVCETHGQVAGCIAAVAYDNSFGFIGLYVVAPAFRGRSPGMLLARRALRALGDRTIGADGVVERLDVYQRIGFRLAYRNARYEGRGGGGRPQGVVDLGAVPRADLIAYDRQLFPAPRAEFLSRWIVPPGGAAYAVRNRGRMVGYGVVRTCGQGSKIGPLFADDPAAADLLFRALAAHAPGQPIFLDIPLPNDAAQDLVTRHGMTQVFATGRIYRGPAPALPLERIFGITTFELG